MPPTNGKRLKNQSLTGKPKTDDLFRTICTHYDPFQSRFLPFPLSVIAQARAWRGHGQPENEKLARSLKALTENGLAEGQVELLIAYCESAIRPIKAAELEMEKLLPALLYTKSATWPPNSAGFVLLEAEFFKQMKFFENKVGKEWVLAAGAVPLSIHGRPPLIAPWVIGVILKRWLMIKKISDEKSETLAIDITSVLLGRLVRPEELGHWESLLNQVQVTHDNGSKTLLPGYLMAIESRMLLQEAGRSVTVEADRTPTHYVQSIPLDKSVVSGLTRAIQKGWKPPKERPSRYARHRQLDGTLPEASVAPGLLLASRCQRCHLLVSPEDIYEHLETRHELDPEQIEPLRHRKELRAKASGELLYKFQE
jgi:hypothetical protein